MNNQSYDKVMNFLNKEFTQTNYNIFIFKNGDGTYELFNRYTISSNKDGTCTVTIKYVLDTKIFSSTKNAVIWCIYEKRNKIYKYQRIEELDRKITSYAATVALYNTLIKSSSDLEKKITYTTKLNEAKLKLELLREELTSYETEAMQWQNSQFSFVR